MSAIEPDAIDDDVHFCAGAGFASQFRTQVIYDRA
jgi:hypothetical protein